MKTSLIPFAAGCLGGCVFVAALLLLDIGGLGTLVMRDQAIFVALFMLLVDLGGLFGIAVMISSLAGEDHAGHGRLQAIPLPAARPLRTPHR